MHYRTGFQYLTALSLLLFFWGAQAHENDLGGLYSAKVIDSVDWDKAERISILFDDNNYEPDNLSLTKGKAYIFEMKNIGGRSHDFVHLEFFHNISIKQLKAKFGRVITHHIHSLFLKTGETIELYFIPQNSGEFEFFCSIEGHRADGMEGYITVID